MFKKAEIAVDTLSIEEKIGQVLMIAVPGVKMNKQAAVLIKKYKPGGIIFFGYNFQNPVQLTAFSKDFQSLSSVPLFISIDQEGGRVVRITRGVEQFPGNMAAGAAGDKDLVRQWGRILGLQLRKLGINMNLAPVVDVNNNPFNPVINIRSFGADPDLAGNLAGAYIEGLQKSRCIAVAKHFPGHGDTNKDSHVTLPVINYTAKRLEKVEYPPFVQSVNSGVEGVMTAHIAYPEILKNYDPATVSPYFLKKILRDTMKFKGLIITDDMEMHAISRRKKMDSAAIEAFKAGADIILISSYGDSIKAIFNGMKQAVQEGVITEKRLNASVKRIMEIKIRYNLLNLNEKTGSLSTGQFEISKDEKELLSRASKVNKLISQNALYYKGKSGLLKKEIHLVTGSPTLRQELKGSPVHVWNSAYKAALFLEKNKKVASSVIVYHMNIPRAQKAKNIIAMLSKKGIASVLLSTGNPFPLITQKAAQNYLFTFSPTTASLKAAAQCLKGEIRYKEKNGFLPELKK